MSAVVLKEVREGVAILTLNRPERLNAWTGEMEHDYFAALDECVGSEEVRVIVLTGAGRGFCAGADMQGLQALGSGEADAAAAANGAARRPQSLPLGIPKPIIAAINGPCAGIGLVQALMCDVRFAAHARSTCCCPAVSCSPRRRASSGSSTACWRPRCCSRQRSHTLATSPRTAHPRAWRR